MIDYALIEGRFLTPRGRSVVFPYREGTSDWNTLNACLTEDEYGLRSLPPLTGSALDLGGHLGGVGIGLAVDNPALRVLIVEPIPENVELARWAVQANGLASRVVVEQGAVGDGSEVEVRFRYTGTETAEHHAFIGNSSLAYSTGGEQPHEVINYTSLTPSDLMERIGGVPELVKVDTEGAEWAFLAGFGADLFPLIIGEWHPVRGHTRDDLVDLLPYHDVTFQPQPQLVDGERQMVDPVGGPGGFRAVRRG